MAAKTARVYTLDELKEKCQQALADPKLVEIVKNAPMNKDGKINLSWVYKEAEKYVHEQTKDLQKTKELAVATRFLAMLRRDQKEEFEKLIAQEKQPEPEVKPVEPKKKFSEIEFSLKPEMRLIIQKVFGGGYEDSYSIKFTDITSVSQPGSDRRSARKFCMEILNALIETADPSGDMNLMNDLIQLLEEKFGLKVMVCGHCKYYVLETGRCSCSAIDGLRRPIFSDPDRIAVPRQFNNKCIMSESKWALKEVSEKKEN